MSPVERRAERHIIEDSSRHPGKYPPWILLKNEVSGQEFIEKSARKE